MINISTFRPLSDEPGNNCIRSRSVNAAGGKHEKLIKAMVPRVVDDAAKELEWKN